MPLIVAYRVRPRLAAVEGQSNELPARFQVGGSKDRSPLQVAATVIFFCEAWIQPAHREGRAFPAEGISLAFKPEERKCGSICHLTLPWR